MSSLYRKYRPRTFSEVIGQQHIVQTLSNAIKHNRVGHAYLFTGPRGTGKTTMARIFSRAINCPEKKNANPCLRCEICKNISEQKSLDVIEIDAASNTGVDNIRDLRETVKLPPTMAKFKIYIIDEVHMLSTGAFNALLKTLEEPPKHVIFILATTEIHKIPETILSRCQRFDFTRLSLRQILEKMAAIAKAEKVKIDQEALEMIALAAEGGMRDAESLLSQIISLEDKHITAKEVKEILGSTEHTLIENMAEKLIRKEGAQAISLLNEIREAGDDLEIFSKTILNYTRQLMILSINEKLIDLFTPELTQEQSEKILALAKSGTTEQFLNILENLLEAQIKIGSAFIPQLPLEIAIVKITGEIKNIPTEETKQTEKPPSLSSSSTKKELPKEATSPAEEIVKEIEHRSTSSEIKLPFSVSEVREKWQEIIRLVHPTNHSVSAFLTNCHPTEISANKILINAPYKIYADKLNEPANCLTLQEAFDKIFKSRPLIKFVHKESVQKKETAPQITSSAESEKSASTTESLFDEALRIIGGKPVI